MLSGVVSADEKGTAKVIPSCTLFALTGGGPRRT
jgi:hypothetical protein